MIFLKMVIMESSSNSLMVIMLKCLRKRGVTGFLPPPGGPMAAMTWMSINFMGVVSFRSYQFQWSNHCLSNSIGGWAPNCSNMGMFKSSTNTIYSNKKNSLNLIYNVWFRILEYHNYTYINTYLSMHEMRVKINLHKICTHTVFKFCFNQSHLFYRINFIPIFADKIHV